MKNTIELSFEVPKDARNIVYNHLLIRPAITWTTGQDPYSKEDFIRIDQSWNLIIQSGRSFLFEANKDKIDAFFCNKEMGTMSRDN